MRKCASATPTAATPSRCSRSPARAKSASMASGVHTSRPRRCHRASRCSRKSRSRGCADWIGGFAVNAGIGIEPHLARFEQEFDDYRSILLKSLADRLAEGCAEWLHRKLRTELWGYAAGESLGVEALVGEEYRGIRP